MTPERRAYNKKYYQEHREKIIADTAVWYKENPEKVKANEQARIAKRKASGEYKAYNLARRMKIKDTSEFKAGVLAWLKKNPEYHLTWRKEHKEEQHLKAVKKREENRFTFRAQCKERYKTDPVYVLKGCLSGSLGAILRKLGAKKTVHTMQLVGCSGKELKTYIEAKFTPEMGWNNYGVYWQIDHIRPCASFNLLELEQQKQCYHYTNLQPLTKEMNNRKSSYWQGKKHFYTKDIHQ